MTDQTDAFAAYDAYLAALDAATTIAAARTRYLDADLAISEATKHLGQLYRDTDTACLDDAEAQANAKASDAVYSMDVWYPAYREAKDAAKHLAETLGLDASRLGSALR